MTQVRLHDRVDRAFGLRERGSTVRVEVLGGVSTFLAMSYIVLVNPAVLAEGGVPWAAAFTATALVAGLATLAVGLWARLPFAVAPGMEINALVVFSVIGTRGFSWQQALGLVFCSGVLMVAVTALGWRARVVEAIPADVRTGLVACVGIFIGVVGLTVGGLVGGDWPGVLASPGAIALGIGFGVACLLRALKVRAAVLVAIAAAAVYCALAGVRADPPKAGEGTAALFALDLGAVVEPAAWGVVLVLFALDFFGSVAKMVGLSANTAIQRDGEVPGIRRALQVDSLATVGGAVVGSTSFVTFVESGVGIRAGARTGLAAVTTGVLLLACLVLAPVLTWIPAVAAGGALLYVALGTLPKPAELRGRSPATPVVVGVMAVVTLLTSALDQALLAGLLAHLVACAVGRRGPGATLLVITALLAVSVAVQYWT
ncbi:solute carrier family 23 protein [Saccharothrix lopnurensis]|uniref:Solute carrier family 23 protein n=1 Tax=Saccharothrix lopnurensis TaxID=1670621 RepID=A0ABW1PCM6_9PSEU